MSLLKLQDMKYPKCPPDKQCVWCKSLLQSIFVAQGANIQKAAHLWVSETLCKCYFLWGTSKRFLHTEKCRVCSDVLSTEARCGFTAVFVNSESNGVSARMRRYERWGVMEVFVSGAKLSLNYRPRGFLWGARTHTAARSLTHSKGNANQFLRIYSASFRRLQGTLINTVQNKQLLPGVEKLNF